LFVLNFDRYDDATTTVGSVTADRKVCDVLVILLFCFNCFCPRLLLHLPMPPFFPRPSPDPLWGSSVSISALAAPAPLEPTALLKCSGIPISRQTKRVPQSPRPQVLPHPSHSALCSWLDFSWSSSSEKEKLKRKKNFFKLPRKAENDQPHPTAEKYTNLFFFALRDKLLSYFVLFSLKLFKKKNNDACLKVLGDVLNASLPTRQLRKECGFQRPFLHRLNQNRLRHEHPTLQRNVFLLASFCLRILSVRRFCLLYDENL
jgi:hypothetical protein